MKRMRMRWWGTGLAALALLSACSGAPQNTRVELPQRFRVPQANLMTLFERRSGRIAVINEKGNLVIMDQTGGAVTPITRDGDDGPVASSSAGNSQTSTSYRWPVWSPDASKIAFIEITAERTVTTRIIEYGAEAVAVKRGSRSLTVEQSDNGTRANSNPNTTDTQSQPSRVTIEMQSGGDLLSSALHVANTDGKSPLNEVFASRDMVVAYVDWSPDNKQLAFLGQGRDGTASVNLVAQGDSAPRTVAVGTAAGWNWHPDGAALLTKVDSTDTDYTADLSIVDAQTAKQMTSIYKDADLPFVAPAFSPDGNSMLITTKSEGMQYLALADRDGKVTRKLSQVDGVVSFSWSPNGTKAAYITQQPTSEQTALPGGVLHLVDVNSGEDRVLSRVPMLAFFWSPDGEHMAVFNQVRPWEMAEDFPGLNLTTRNATTVYMLQNLDVKAGTFRQLFYFEPTDAFSRMLRQFDRFSRSMTIWAPDSRHLVLPVVYTDATSTSTNLILETESTGSINPRQISEGSLAVWSPK